MSAKALTAVAATWLEEAARRSPERLAFVANGERLTYAAWNARVAELADRLSLAGALAGRPIAVQSSSASSIASLTHAADRLRTPLVLLHPRLTPSEVEPLLERTAPRLLLGDSGPEVTSYRSVDLASGISESAISASGIPESGAPESGASETDADHCLLFTSGTSGRPKAVRLGLSQHRASAEANRRWLGLSASDRWLLCMPPFHIGGLAIVMRCALFQSALFAHDRFDAEAVQETLAAEGITHVSLVPTMLTRLLEAGGDPHPPATLRCVLLGGGPIAPRIAARALELGWPLAGTYGLTEAASSVATSRPGAPEFSWLHPLPGTEVQVRDPDRTPLSAGEVGEIWVRGAQLMRGYLDDPEATAEALVNGWLRTGDIGELDASGRLRVLERRDDLIISGGENVYPAELEAVLSEHPRVSEVAVVPAPDAHWGQQVVAWILPSEASPAARECSQHLDVSELEAELRRHCESRLAAFKRPRQFVFVDHPLPRTASGKLRRATLRAQVTS